MPRQTDNLHLQLPLGSKNWNYDTWNENMKILDKAFTDLREIIISMLTAENIPFTSLQLQATNVQDAIDEIKSRRSWIKFVDVNSNMNFDISANAHCYLTLAFADTVPSVSFTNSANREFLWINGYPVFEPNSVYELSFLDLACVWAKRKGAIDWKEFFWYYIENDVIYLCNVKHDVWYDHFGNYNFYVPAEIDGMPVVMDNTGRHWFEE